MDNSTSTIQFDECQQVVINARGGFHLVLAPPGCGKTQILTERIRQSHSLGIDYGDMLCLTFTNRAARGMLERISQHLDDEAVKNLYVGNVHRYCARFLFDNEIVNAGAAIIDEDDAISILSEICDEDETLAVVDRNKRRQYGSIIQLAGFMHQIRHGHPKSIRIHGDSLLKGEVDSIKYICQKQQIDFTAEAMLNIYDNCDFYTDFAPECTQSLSRLSIAKTYETYKRDNNILDFEDLLTLAYDTLAADTDGKFHRYRWVQIDEVQDLNPLQLSIIDQLTAEDFDTVLYLGDEQQAIFSFMGAKINTLEQLKGRCQGNIHHLLINHRAPKYLLDVLNEFAVNLLKISPELLPKATNYSAANSENLGIITAKYLSDETHLVVDKVEQLYQSNDSETTAVIVNSNADADAISNELNNRKLSHFKVSGSDMFATPDMKLLLAHFSILSSEADFLSWSRILKGMKIFSKNDAARQFVRMSFDNAILPSEFLIYDGKTTYTQEFTSAYETTDIVVFDTETTGLNAAKDDIVQIAAVKMRQGKIVEGSQVSLFIATDKPIPEKLGDIENPIIEEMKHHKLLSHAEALQTFIDYAKGCALVAHNAEFDYNILRYNLLRYLPNVDLPSQFPKYFDTLRLMRLLEPEQRQYKLKKLIETFGLEGQNTHLADDDVFATVGVVQHCYAKSVEIADFQKQFMQRNDVQKAIKLLCENYSELYFHSQNLLHEQAEQDIAPTLVNELNYIYSRLVEGKFSVKIDKLGYFTAFLSGDVINADDEPTMYEQIVNHSVELHTVKEADLCNSNVIKDRIFVTTIHKAKGLEFDNVIIFDAVDGRIPNFLHENDAEDARKFYVALSRAKRRLFVANSMMVNRNGKDYSRQITPFMIPILRFFRISKS